MVYKKLDVLYRAPVRYVRATCSVQEILLCRAPARYARSSMQCAKSLVAARYAGSSMQQTWI